MVLKIMLKMIQKLGLLEKMTVAANQPPIKNILTQRQSPLLFMYREARLE